MKEKVFDSNHYLSLHDLQQMLYEVFDVWFDVSPLEFDTGEGDDNE